MATTLSELSLVIRARADQISSDIEKGIRKSQGRFQATGKVIGIALAAGVAASAGLIVAAFKRGVDQVDALAAAAQKIGLSTGGLAKLQLMAKLTDSSFEGLTQGIAKMQANLAKAQAGGDPKLVAGLKILKLDLAELRALAPEQQFMKIAGALGQMSDKGAQLALGKQIFGKGFLEFANLAEAGAAKLQEMAHMADVLGLTVSERMVGAIGEFDNATHLAMSAWDGFSRQLAGEIAPQMSGLGNMIVKNVEEMGGMNNIAKQVAEAIKQIVAFALDAAYGVKLIGTALAHAWALVQQLLAGFYAWGTKGAATVVKGLGEIALAMSKMLRDQEAGMRKMVNDTSLGIRTVFQALTISVTKSIEEMVNKMRSGISEVRTLFGGSALAPVTLTPSTLPDAPQVAGGTGASDALFATGMGLQATSKDLEAVSVSLQDLRDENKATAAEIAEAYKEPAWGQEFLANAEARKNIIFETGKVAQQTQTDLSSMYEKADKTRKKHIDKTAKDTATAFKQMQDANRQLVGDMVYAWATGTGKMSDIIHQWAQQSLRKIIDVLLFGAGQGGGGGLIGSFAGGGGGGGWGAVAGLAAGLFGGGAGAFSALGGAVGGVTAFAEGGQTRGNQAILVGERGPEMFIPKSSGNVIPNGAMGTGGASIHAPIIQNTFSVGVSRIELAGILDAVEERTTAGVVAAYERGGNMRRRMRS